MLNYTPLIISDLLCYVLATSWNARVCARITKRGPKYTPYVFAQAHKKETTQPCAGFQWSAFIDPASGPNICGDT
jgi:hypothetical protein